MRYLIFTVLALGLCFSSCGPEERANSKASEEVTKTPDLEDREQQSADYEIKLLKAENKDFDRRLRQLEKSASKDQGSGFLSSILSVLSLVGFLGLGAWFLLKFRGIDGMKREVKLFREKFGDLTNGGDGKGYDPPNSGADAGANEGYQNQAPTTSPRSSQPAYQPPPPEAERSQTPPPRREFAEEPTSGNYAEQAPVPPPKFETGLAPVYALSPVNGSFQPNRLEDEPTQFTYFIIRPEADGQSASFDVVDDLDLQRQILDSQAGHAGAIDFVGRPSGGQAQVGSTEGGLLQKSGNGWRIIRRIQLHLR